MSRLVCEAILYKFAEYIGIEKMDLQKRWIIMRENKC